MVRLTFQLILPLFFTWTAYAANDCVSRLAGGGLAGLVQRALHARLMTYADAEKLASAELPYNPLESVTPTSESAALKRVFATYSGMERGQWVEEREKLRALLAATHEEIQISEVAAEDTRELIAPELAFTRDYSGSSDMVNYKGEVYFVSYADTYDTKQVAVRTLFDEKEILRIPYYMNDVVKIRLNPRTGAPEVRVVNYRFRTGFSKGGSAWRRQFYTVRTVDLLSLRSSGRRFGLAIPGNNGRILNDWVNEGLRKSFKMRNGRSFYAQYWLLEKETIFKVFEEGRDRSPLLTVSVPGIPAHGEFFENKGKLYFLVDQVRERTRIYMPLDDQQAVYTGDFNALRDDEIRVIADKSGEILFFALPRRQQKINVIRPFARVN